MGRVSQAENIDCHYARGGSLRIATAPFHADRHRRELDELHQLGFTESDYQWLEPAVVRARLNMTPNYGGLYFAHCAAVQPARLWGRLFAALVG